jgi:hypothetical protein
MGRVSPAFSASLSRSVTAWPALTAQDQPVVGDAGRRLPVGSDRQLVLLQALDGGQSDGACQLAGGHVPDVQGPGVPAAQDQVLVAGEGEDVHELAGLACDFQGRLAGGERPDGDGRVVQVGGLAGRGEPAPAGVEGAQGLAVVLAFEGPDHFALFQVPDFLPDDRRRGPAGAVGDAGGRGVVGVQGDAQLARLFGRSEAGAHEAEKQRHRQPTGTRNTTAHKGDPPFDSRIAPGPDGRVRPAGGPVRARVLSL